MSSTLSNTVTHSGTGTPGGWSKV